MLTQLRDFAHSWALTDQVGTIRRGAVHDMKPRPFYLLKNHPLLSGLLIFRLNILMNDVGIAFCNAWDSMVYSAHLYNAARQGTNLEEKWGDVEFLVHVHSSQGLFLGLKMLEATEIYRGFPLGQETGGIDSAKNGHQRCVTAPLSRRKSNVV